jgi:hypothetical protein
MSEIDFLRHTRQSIWFPSGSGEYRMEDVCCLLDLVLHPSWHNLLAHA